MNMDQYGFNENDGKESSSKKNIFDKFCSGSIHSFNNYNDDNFDYNNNYHSCEIETIEPNRVDLEKIPHVSICFYHLDFLGLAKIIKFFH